MTTNKRKRSNEGKPIAANKDPNRTIASSLTSSVLSIPSPRHTSRRPQAAAAAPILILREIERCLICHFLDLPSIAHLLCTSKFFSSITSSVVLWKPVLYCQEVRLSSAQAAASFCQLDQVICKALVKLEIGDNVCTEELCAHLVHLPHLQHLTFPVQDWMGGGRDRWMQHWNIYVHA